MNSSNSTETVSHTSQTPLAHMAEALSEPLVILTFWQRFQKYILGAIVAVIAFLVVSQAQDWYQARKLEKTQLEYVKADSLEAKKAFTVRYAGSQLAGVMALSVADLCFTSGEFTEAVKYYNQAADTLKVSPLGARAMLSCAVAYVSDKKLDAARGLLDQVVLDSKMLSVFRAEACYLHALLDMQANNFEAANQYLDTLQQLPQSLWTYKGDQLRMQLNSKA